MKHRIDVVAAELKFSLHANVQKLKQLDVASWNDRKESKWG